MARKKNITRTGLPQFLSSTLRTVRLKDLAEKRGKRLHILRKFIERMLYPNVQDMNDIERARLKIEDFAPQIDIKPGTWKRLEDAESCLSIEAAEWIAVQVLDKFGVFVTIDWLLGEVDTLDLPRVVNKNPLDLYSYLKDLFKAEDLSKQIEDADRILVKQTYQLLEVYEAVEDIDQLKKVFGKVAKFFQSKEEQDQFNEILKKEGKGPFKSKSCDLLKSLCRRLIMSADISNEERSTRAVLVGFFISDLFQKISPDSIVTYVRDNKMVPTFLKGEIVGGLSIPLQEIYKADKRECIIQLSNSVKIVRILHYISGNTIIANTTSNENSPEIYTLNDIKSVAIISFRYKNFERDGLNMDFGDDKAPQLIEFADIISK